MARCGGEAVSTAEGSAGTGAAAPLATLVLVVAAALAPAWLGAGAFLARDDGRMHAAVKRFVAAELAAGRLPEWNPYSGLGAPVVATMIDGVQHPFTLLLLALPVEWALTAWVTLSVMGAALGAWWWARRLGAGPGAALVAGFGFALSGPLLSATDNVTYLTALATLPAFLAATLVWLERGGALRLAGVGLLSYLLAAAGDAQSWGLAVAATLPLVGLVAERQTLGRRVTRALEAVAVSALTAAPVVLPLLLWLPHSSRAGALDAADRVRWSLAPVRLVELLVPDLLRAPPGAMQSPLHQALSDPTSLVPWYVSIYLGVTLAGLAVAGAAMGRRARWLLGAAALFAWMALGHHAGFGQLAALLPFLRGFRYWEKLAPWIALALAGAAALAMEGVGRDARGARRLATGFGAAAAVALAALPLVGSIAGGLSPAMAVGLAENLGDGLRHAAILAAVAALAAWALARGSRRAPAFLVALVAADLAAANVRAYELQSSEVSAPSSPLAAHLRALPGLQRVVTPFEPMVERRGFSPGEASNLLGARTLAAAWNVGYGVGNFDAYTGAAPGRLDAVTRSLSPDRLLPNVGLWAVGHAVVPGSLAMAASAGLAPPLRVEAEDPALPAWLVAVPHRPRAYLTARASVATPGGARAFALDPASVAGDLSVVEGELPANLEDSGGEARVEDPTPTRVEVATRARGAALLVLNDTWAPGWTARIDGVPAPILRANHLVRGVVVPSGTHLVAFEYRTPGLRAGWLIALAGWAALALLVWLERRAASRGATASGSRGSR